MKKFFSLIAAVLFAGSMMADVVTLDPATQDPIPPASSNVGADIELTIDGIGIAYNGSLNEASGSTPADFRVFGGQNLVLSASDNISKVVILGKANKAGWAPTVSSGTITAGASYDAVTTKTDVEDPLFAVEGIDAKSVTILCNKQLRAYSIIVTTDGEGGGGDDPQEITLDVKFADAMYIPSYEAWQFNLYKDYDYETQEVEYPDFYVAVPMKSETAIAGTYAAEDIMFIELDLAEGTVAGVESSDLVVTYLGEGLYHFEMTFVGDDGNTYIVDATLKPVAYDYPNYNEIILTDELDPSNVENVVVKSATIKKIENGQLMIEKNGVRYNANGAVVR